MFFSPFFTFPTLLGLLGALCLAPVVIHVITMLRHRRVKWAAMDFLLQSYRKQKNWIRLQQLLLLLLRMGVVFLLVMMLANVGCRQIPLSALFGQQTTHHILLLDDSFSMSEQIDSGNLFDRAIGVVRNIAQRAQAGEGRQRLTLIRFSRAARHDWSSSQNAVQASSAVGTLADLNAVAVDANVDVLLEEKRRGFAVSDLSVGPEPPLALVRRLQEASADAGLGNTASGDRTIVYLISDFRAKDWRESVGLSENLQALEDAGVEIRFIRCANEKQSNLAIVDIQPESDTRAAGVPLFVNIRVKNDSEAAARRVQLHISTTMHDPTQAESKQPGEAPGVSEELPIELIDEIGPGETVVRRVQVYFDRPGAHVVTASLPDDPLLLDNTRYCVLNFPEAERVLLIDGAAEQTNSRYLQTAFTPGGRVFTGVQAVIEPPSYLRGADDLNAYSAIYLLDVARLDGGAVGRIENYVRDGGGLAIFAGPNLDLRAYNEDFYRNGEGLFPAPLKGDGLLPPAAEEDAADLQLEDHPLFQAFLGERNPLLRHVLINRYVTLADEGRPSPDAGMRVLARLRNGAPLVLERLWGDGRAVVVLTTSAPLWNNWAQNPGFVVFALKLQSYLAEPLRFTPERFAGEAITTLLKAEQYSAEIVYAAPGRTEEDLLLVRRVAVPDSADKTMLRVVLGGAPVAQTAASESEAEKPPSGDEPAVDDKSSANNKTSPPAVGGGETERRGIYERWAKRSTGEADVARYALNIAPLESELGLIQGRALLEKLAPLSPQISDWRAYSLATAADAADASPWSGRNLLWGLVLLLLLELLAAYWLSYHPRRREAIA